MSILFLIVGCALRRRDGLILSKLNAGNGKKKLKILGGKILSIGPGMTTGTYFEFFGFFIEMNSIFIV